MKTFKNMWLWKHPETRIIRDTGKRVLIVSYSDKLAFTREGVWCELGDLEPKA